MATKAQLAQIKKLQANIKAQQEKVAATEKIAFDAEQRATASVVKMDPSYGVELAQAKKDAAPAGSPAYTEALRELTQAKNVASGVTKERDILRDRIAAGPDTTTGTPTQTFTPPADNTNNVLLQQLLSDQQAAASQAAMDKQQSRQSAIEVLTARFKQYGLESLASTIQRLAVDGATEATITLGLMETSEYKQRFKANELRIKSGTTVLTPAEYLNLEDTYRQVLRSYGLKQFDTDAYVSQFIANDMSPTELSNRVVTAVQRVQNADPAVLSQLTSYYGIGSKDLVAYVLDPSQQFQKIERQVAAGEIGVAAARQGITAGVTVAEQLAAQGITQAEAQKGYSTIADILPEANKLSDIYGGQVSKYGQAEAEQEVFNGLASAQRKRQRLAATETGTFSGSSGVNKSSLSSGKQGYI
jgi:hypothetical protein